MSIDFDVLVAESRSVPLTEAEITGDKFYGYAAVYGEVADLGDFTEESQRGSFRKVLAAQREPIPFVYDHKHDRIPMAFTHAGTLRLSEDTKGLYVEADLPSKNPDADTLREQMERGEVRHMSYGFIAGRGNSKVEHRGSKPHRVLTGYNMLLDVSPTWQPAYRGTSAELRNALLGAIPDLSQTSETSETSETSQQDLEGAHQQLEDGVTQEIATDAGPVESTSADVPSEESQEERSGAADDPMVAAAARRRRLQMMGLTLP